MGFAHLASPLASSSAVRNTSDVLLCILMSLAVRTALRSRFEVPSGTSCLYLPTLHLFSAFCASLVPCFLVFCICRPLSWPGSLEHARPSLVACRSRPPWVPRLLLPLVRSPETNAVPYLLGHGGAREDAPRGTLASADAARLPPYTRQGVQQPRLCTLGCSIHQNARTASPVENASL